MEEECTYYREQTTTTPRNEETIEEIFCEPSLEDPLGEHFDQFCDQAVVENQVDERKEEQTEDLEESHQEKKKRALRLFQHWLLFLKHQEAKREVC
jgi:hypothetical protein